METKNTTVESTNNVESKSVPSKKVESSSDDEDEEVCLICCNPITFYSVGPCNHRQTCSMCSIRLRELYKDKECPFCKKTNEKVVFTTNKTLPFEQFKLSELIEESALGIYTDSDEHIATIKQLWDARCPVCSIYYVEFAELKKHIKTAHQAQYCELCLQERKIFLHEQKVYNKKQLQQHMREGDEGSQIKGHPKCEFCDRSLYSSDLLYEHLERNHFTCHICEKDGHRFQYYKDYNQLEKHFGSAHYLCPERDCLEKKFIVFRTLLDLQAHELNVHGYKFSKQEQTKLRQIQVNFTVSRSEEPRNSRNNRYDRQEFDRHIAAPTTNVFQNATTSPPPVSQPELKKEEEPPKENKKHMEEELKQELAARNKKLIQTMKDILQDDVKFKEFRTTSGQFLTGAITELQYYKSFVTTFGPKKADELFSELIDLLPDETKREKLLSAQRKTKEEEKEYPQLPAQPPKPAKNKKKTNNAPAAQSSVWKAPAATAPTTTTTTTTSSRVMKPVVEGIHCSECGEQVPSKDWDKHLKLHARQKQQIEEQAKQVKIQEEQRKREIEEKKRDEEKKKEEEQAQRNKLSSSSEFPSLPGAPPGLNLLPKNATIFNRKAFSENDFPSLPLGQKPSPPPVKFEDVEPERVEEEVGKKGKKQNKKVVLRWG